MFQLDSLGKWLFVIGAAIAALGGLLFLLGKIPFVSRIGSLPGDIRWQSADGRLSCFVPIVSSILISIILTIALNIIARLLSK